MNARDIKKAIEAMVANGMERIAIVKRVMEMGVDAEWAELMVSTYARKFNK